MSVPPELRLIILGLSQQGQLLLLPALGSLLTVPSTLAAPNRDVMRDIAPVVERLFGWAVAIDRIAKVTDEREWLECLVVLADFDSDRPSMGVVPDSRIVRRFPQLVRPQELDSTAARVLAELTNVDNTV